MSVELTNATADRVEFGDIATDGLTALTVAVTLKVGAVPVDARNILGKANAWPDQAFSITVKSTQDIGFLIVSNANALFGEITTGNLLVNGALSRILCTWTNVGGQAIEIWHNGVQASTFSWWALNPTEVRASAAPFWIGHRGFSAANAMGGDYAEVAVWNHVVPRWFREAYGKGLSPRFYRNGGILHNEVWNTDHLRDRWGGILGVNTGGANARHPGVYYPPPPQLAPSLAVAGPPSLGDLIALAASDDSQVALAGSANGLVTVAGSDDSKIPVGASE